MRRQIAQHRQGPRPYGDHLVAPHHVPKEWIAKYKGKFDQGWDKYREETLARQIKLGVVPPGTTLAPKPQAIKDWEALSADEKGLFARQMEVFAAFGEHTDHEIGRLVKAIEDMGAMENTLFIYIAGDNGASGEGSLVGLFNETSFFNGVPENSRTCCARSTNGAIRRPIRTTRWAGPWQGTRPLPGRSKLPLTMAARATAR